MTKTNSSSEDLLKAALAGTGLNPDDMTLEKVNQRLRTQSDANEKELTARVGSLNELVVQLLSSMHNIDGDTVAKTLATSTDPCTSLKLLMNSKHLTNRQFEAATTGVTMIERGTITFPQFAVAYGDDCTDCGTLLESLKVRGWLPAE